MSVPVGPPTLSSILSQNQDPQILTRGAKRKRNGTIEFRECIDEDLPLCRQCAMPHRKRRRRAQSVFRLMQLPTEVRKGVLVELLSSPEPCAPFTRGYEEEIKDRVCRSCDARLYRCISSTQNFKLYPQILQVCSQLHDEGLPILYGSNVFEIRATVSGRLSSHYSFLNYFKPFSTYHRNRAWQLDPLPLAWVKKIRVVFHLDGDEGPERSRDRIRRMNSVLCSNFHNIDSLSIMFAARKDEFSSFSFTDELVKPFFTIRGLKHVSFEGLDHQSHIQDLIQSMTSPGRPNDLIKLYDRVLNFIREHTRTRLGWGPVQPWWTEDLAELYRAMDTHDVELFLRTRQAVMDRIMADIERDCRRVFDEEISKGTL